MTCVIGFFFVAALATLARSEQCNNDGNCNNVREIGSSLLQRRSSKALSISGYEGDDDVEIDPDIEISEESFTTIQDQCCFLSFDGYCRKLMSEMQYEICDEGCHNGFMPFVYCGKAATLADLRTSIVKNSQEYCGCYAPIGQCTSGGLPQACREANTGEFNPSWHRRRTCSRTTAAPDMSPETTTMAVPRTTETLNPFEEVLEEAIEKANSAGASCDELQILEKAIEAGEAAGVVNSILLDAKALYVYLNAKIGPCGTKDVPTTTTIAIQTTNPLASAPTTTTLAIQTTQAGASTTLNAFEQMLKEVIAKANSTVASCDDVKLLENAIDLAESAGGSNSYISIAKPLLSDLINRVGPCRTTSAALPTTPTVSTTVVPPAAAPTTTVAPTTTIAPTTTAASMTTISPATTAAPTATTATTTTIAPTTTAVPTTTAAPTTTAGGAGGTSGAPARPTPIPSATAAPTTTAASTASTTTAESTTTVVSTTTAAPTTTELATTTTTALAASTTQSTTQHKSLVECGSLLSQVEEWCNEALQCIEDEDWLLQCSVEACSAAKVFNNDEAEIEKAIAKYNICGNPVDTCDSDFKDYAENACFTALDACAGLELMQACIADTCAAAQAGDETPMDIAESYCENVFDSNDTTSNTTQGGEADACSSITSPNVQDNSLEMTQNHSICIVPLGKNDCETQMARNSGGRKFYLPAGEGEQSFDNGADLPGGCVMVCGAYFTGITSCQRMWNDPAVNPYRLQGTPYHGAGPQRSGVAIYCCGAGTLSTTTTTTSWTFGWVPHEPVNCDNPAPQPINSPALVVIVRPPSANYGYCKVVGDPYLQPFDGTGSGPRSFLKHGNFWLVKSSTVWIQGHYASASSRRPSWSTLRRLAIGGPFLQGNTIIVDSTRAKIWINAESLPIPLMNSAGTPASSSDSAYTAMNSAVEMWSATRAYTAYITINFPNHDIKVEARIVPLGLAATRGLPQMFLRIGMRQIPDQTGHCGNFNGDTSEERDMLSTDEFKVDPSQDLLDNCD
jgi:hypothetical protein